MRSAERIRRTYYRRPVSRESYSGIDQRGIPSHECVNCGSNVFTIGAGFEDYNISFWFTEGKCAGCGAPVTVPTPVDAPEE